MLITDVIMSLLIIAQSPLRPNVLVNTCCWDMQSVHGTFQTSL